MKRTAAYTRGILFLILIMLCISSCDVKNDSSQVWENATYKEDVELGQGNKTVKVAVRAESKTVNFTINTDAETLGDALMEHKLISGEQGAYGMYVKIVNGIKADYDENQCYWGFNKNGESMMTGVDGEAISGGENYEIIYIKQ